MGPDRRRHERTTVIPAYTGCRVRLQREDGFRFDGHVHDISEGGVRFEADVPVDPGTPVALQIDLPHRDSSADADGPGRAVFVIGNVVWCNIEEPGPAIMAMAITRYARAGDRERLLRRLAGNGFARRAA